MNWGPPNLIHTSGADDKQAIAGDRTPTSPFYGRVYAAWDDRSNLAFARSLDNGRSWAGVGSSGAGTPLANTSFSPEIAIDQDGAIYIVWITGNNLNLVQSTDGGDTFTAPMPVVRGLTPLASPPLSAPNGFPDRDSIAIFKCFSGQLHPKQSGR